MSLVPYYSSYECNNPMKHLNTTKLSLALTFPSELQQLFYVKGKFQSNSPLISRKGKHDQAANVQAVPLSLSWML